MPELPDLAVYKHYFDATSLHQEISAVDLKEGGLLKNTSLSELKDALLGHEFLSTRRYGKWLFSELDHDPWLVLHFGMTGELKYFRDQDDVPQYSQLLICFANGDQLAYVSIRKLGEIRFIQEVDPFLQAKQLGPDAQTLDQAQFLALLKDRRGMIKSALMDQQLIAGIGNVYSDEILFQAGIHPRTPVSELEIVQLRKIFRQLGQVLETSIENQADPDQFPDHYLTPRRDIPGSCPRCGGKLEKAAVSGRGAYYCPACQPREKTYQAD